MKIHLLQPSCLTSAAHLITAGDWDSALTVDTDGVYLMNACIIIVMSIVFLDFSADIDRTVAK